MGCCVDDFPACQSSFLTTCLDFSTAPSSCGTGSLCWLVEPISSCMLHGDRRWLTINLHCYLVPTRRLHPASHGAFQVRLIRQIHTPSSTAMPLVALAHSLTRHQTCQQRARLPRQPRHHRRRYRHRQHLPRPRPAPHRRVLPRATTSPPFQSALSSAAS